jgi:regulatory protein
MHRQELDEAKAWNLAFKLAIYRPVSKKELKLKLIKKGIDEDQADSLLSKLIQEEIYNEQAIIDDFIQYYKGRAKGPRYILQELIRKGFPSAVVKAEIESNYSKAEEYGLLKGLLRSYINESTDAEKRRFIQAAQRRGFSSSDAYRLLKPDFQDE